MRPIHAMVPILTVLAGLLVVPCAGATTLIRQGLDRLSSGNEMIVQGKVLGVHSYWNADRSFILTDVRLATARPLKGGPAGEVTFTVPGGTVGDVTVLIVGGPELVPGADYLLFLSRDDLPGRRGPLTVRDLAQGVFDLVPGPRGLRAVSQAVHHPLLPDARGRTDAPGGSEGLELDEMLREVSRHAEER